MPVLVRCFSYTPHAILVRCPLTHLMVVLVRGFSYLMLVLVSRFSYRPLRVLVKCFSCTPDDSSSKVLHVSFSEVFLLHMMLVLVRCFSYTSHASFSGVFFLHS